MDTDAFFRLGFRALGLSFWGAVHFQKMCYLQRGSSKCTGRVPLSTNSRSTSPHLPV